MVGYDHPFADGNGRTARALFYWSMLRSGYWLAEFISISHILRKAPAQYGRAYLFTETDGGDTTYFLIHQLAERVCVACLYRGSQPFDKRSKRRFACRVVDGVKSDYRSCLGLTQHAESDQQE